MSEIAIRFENLSKHFGRRRKQVKAVQNLNLEIAAGQVYGFLGPNGAGKSTTIRMIMDLIRPTEGDVFLFGRHVRHEHAILEQRVGAMVEGAMFYNFLSGQDNLDVLARTNNRHDHAQIAALLEQVGLAERAGQRVKGYSTGMKQRLGLAAALLGDPDLVILDEPTNGLDPGGMREIRYFIRNLVDNEGKTVFLSSHLLGEVEQICDRVAIIDRGRIVQEGAVADLLSAKSRLQIEAEPLEQALNILQPQWACAVEDKWLFITAGRADAPQIIQTLVGHGIQLFQVRLQRQSLEDFFLSVTGAPDDAEEVAGA